MSSVNSMRTEVTEYDRISLCNVIFSLHLLLLDGQDVASLNS